MDKSSEAFEAEGQLPQGRVQSTFLAVPDDRLVLDWKLLPAETSFVTQSTNLQYRPWVALNLLHVRRSKRYPEEDETFPFACLAFINRQFEIPPENSIVFPIHDSTRTRIRQRIAKFLQLEEFGQSDIKKIENWMLLQASAGKGWGDIEGECYLLLKTWPLILPAVSTLKRQLQSSWQKAEEALWAKISSSLTVEMNLKIEAFLAVKGSKKRTILFTFKEVPKKINSTTILDFLERCFLLQEISIEKIDLACVSPKLVKQLAAYARTYDVNRLRKMECNKRNAIVACFLKEAQGQLYDIVIQLNDTLLSRAERKARNQEELNFKDARKRVKKSLKFLTELAKAVAIAEPESNVAQLQKNFAPEVLHAAVGSIEQLNRIEERGFLDEILKKLPNIKRYFVAFSKLPICAETGSESILKAISIFQHGAENKVKSLSSEAPTDFVPSTWKEAFESADNRERLRIWEISLILEIKKRLRSLDLYIPQSHHHRSFWKLVHDEEAWKQKSSAAYETLGLPKSFSSLQRQLHEDLEKSFQTFQDKLPTNSFVEVSSDGSMQLHRDQRRHEAEGLTELLSLIESCMPKHVPIEKILWDVDRLTGFTDELRPTTASRREPDSERMLTLATCLAHATNIGLAGMATATRGVSVDELLETTRSRLSLENLSRCNARLVDFHLKYPFSSTFGDGSITSSDGQRFAVREDGPDVGLCTRYFGFWKGAVTVYTHTADNYSVFSTTVLSCGVREAIAVIDGLFSSGTEVRPFMHTTDTHGYTDALFGLMHLLGMQFAPRLKDIGKLNLFRLEGFEPQGLAANIFQKSAKTLSDSSTQWDNMVRVASALSSGHVSAQVILPKIFQGCHADKLSEAFSNLGQIVKTTFLLRYLADSDLRSRIRVQLNRGEHRHALARHVFFSNKGEFRNSDLDSLVSKASCLSLVCNAILIWNTLNLERIVNSLESRGNKINRSLLQHISPLAWEHIRVSGKYDFRALADEETIQ